MTAARTSRQHFDMRSAEQPQIQAAIEASRRDIMVLWNRTPGAVDLIQWVGKLPRSQSYSENRQRESNTSA